MQPGKCYGGGQGDRHRDMTADFSATDRLLCDKGAKCEWRRRRQLELCEESATVISTLELLDEQVIDEPLSKPEPLRAVGGGGKVIPLKRR